MSSLTSKLAVICIIIFGNNLHALNSLPANVFFEGNQVALSIDEETIAASSNLENFNINRTFSDSEYANRLAQINSDVPLTFNKDVLGYINAYTGRQRSLSEKILGLSDIYFPIMDEIFAENGIPSELKYLSIPESALNSSVTSRMGAAGLWQFMPATGRQYGLIVNEYIDERLDPYKSTKAVAKYLNDLYNIYGDWLLVIASYNCGPGTVKKAINKSGGQTDFWTIKKFLPKETNGYVPAYIATVYWMNYYFDHYLYAAPPPFPNAFKNTELVNAAGGLYLSKVANFTGVNLDELKFINPSLKKQQIPKGVSNYAFRMPANEVTWFEMNKTAIYDSDISATAFVNNKPKSFENTNFTSSISSKNTNTSVSGTVNFSNSSNGIYNNNLLPKNTADEVVIYEETGIYNNKIPLQSPYHQNTYNNNTDFLKYEDNIVYSSNLMRQGILENDTEVNTKKPNTYKEVIEETQVHTVKKGESLPIIAQNNNCSVSALKRWNNLNSNTIHPNQKIKIVKNKTITKVFKPELEDEVLIEESTSKTSNSNLTSIEESESIIDYVIKKGDSLWTIAKKFPTCSVQLLLEINNLTTKDNLLPGSIIKVLK